MASALHGQAQEAHSVTVETPRRVPTLPIATGRSGDAVDQPDAAWPGAIVCCGTCQRVLQLHGRGGVGGGSMKLYGCSMATGFGAPCTKSLRQDRPHKALGRSKQESVVRGNPHA